MLREFLEQSGQTQAKLARRLGISTAHMSELLSGRKMPSLTLAYRIERLTNGAVPVSAWVPTDKDDAA